MTVLINVPIFRMCLLRKVDFSYPEMGTFCICAYLCLPDFNFQNPNLEYHTFFDNITMDIREIWCVVVDWIYLLQYRHIGGP